MGKKVTLDATAEDLGISVRGVRRLISSGELRAYRVGKHSVRIDVDDIAAVLKPILPDTALRNGSGPTSPTTKPALSSCRVNCFSTPIRALAMSSHSLSPTRSRWSWTGWLCADLAPHPSRKAC